MSCIGVILRNSPIPGDGYVLNRPLVGAIMPKEYPMRTSIKMFRTGPIGSEGAGASIFPPGNDAPALMG